ncbi:MAG: hypothetical protein AB7S81_00060 [Bdellovibrionales bacterium]
MSLADLIKPLFVDPVLSKAAFYQPKGGTGFDVRVITKQPDTITSFGEAQIHSETHLFDVQAAEVASPQIGDQLIVGGVTYQVQLEPKADRERLIWTLDAVPV